MRQRILAGIILSLTAATSNGAILNYTVTGFGSGILGNTNFSSAAFTITAVGDTANRTAILNGWAIPNSSAAISIAGVGSTTFLTGTRFFVNNEASIVGFSRTADPQLDLYNGPSDIAFATWDMETPIGPIYGQTYLLQWGSIQTTAGDLYFEDNTTSGTFQAAVPIPAAVWLLGSALGVLGVMRRRAVA